MHRGLAHALVRCALPGAALTMVCFLAPAGLVVSPEHAWLYHLDGAPWRVLLPLMLDALLVWAAAMGLLAAAARVRRVASVVYPGVVSLLPWALLAQGLLLNLWRVPRRVPPAALAVCLLCWIVWVRLWWTRPASWERLQEAVVGVLQFGGIAALAVFAQMLWYGWQARNLNRPQQLHVHATGAASRRGPRVIWIIFDELSYQQVYERRFAGLDLPAFDRLRAESTMFSQVNPAAEFTEVAVPSMLTGIRAEKVRASADGERVALGLGRSWTPVRAEDTVFADALRLGYRTAVAGWYLPYCRNLAPVLDRCEWHFREDSLGRMKAEDGVAANMSAPLRALSGKMHGAGASATVPEETIRARILDYESLLNSADEMLGDSSLGFVLLHLPAPHPPGFYDRRTGHWAMAGGSYLDNLALADRTLAHIRGVLEAQREWDSSAVLVMGDHSWRTSLIWRGERVWTAEDEAASAAGRFDDRPVYMLKLPGQSAPGRVDAAFDAVRTRALLNRLVAGEFRSAGDVTRFAASSP